MFPPNIQVKGFSSLNYASNIFITHKYVDWDKKKNKGKGPISTIKAFIV